MGYGYGNFRNNGIPKLTNYKEAFDWWNNTKPIRGREVDTRPLGHRRRVDEYQIRKADDGTIECVLWRDAVVKFKPDGTIRLGNPFYSSTSVANFINDILHNSRVSAYIFDFDLVIKVFDGDYLIEQRAGDWGVKDFKDTDGNVYDIPDESVGLDENYHFLEDKPEVMRKIKRKALREVMERYKPFTEYMSNYHKVNGEVYSLKDYHKGGYNLIGGMYRNWGAQDAIQAGTKLMELLTDKTDRQYDSYYYALMMLVDATSGSFVYDLSRGEKRVQLSSIQKTFEKFIKGVHRDEVLDITYRTDNRVVRRRYREYFFKRWDFLIKGLKDKGLV